MIEDYKQIYEGLADTDKKAFRRALAEGDKITAAAYIKAAGADLDKFPDIKPDTKKSDSTILHENTRKNSRKLNIDYRERHEAGIFSDKELKEFKRTYNHIINDVCIRYYSEHEDIVKKTPFIWYNSLLYELKKELPQINIKDSAAVGVAWEAYTGLMYKIGLFPTMEAFTTLTGIYKDQLNRELTPGHVDLKNRIYQDCKNNMVAQVGYNPMTQVNKMFLLKSVYGFSENNGGQATPPDHTAKNIDDIPVFLIEDTEISHNDNT